VAEASATFHVAAIKGRVVEVNTSPGKEDTGGADSPEDNNEVAAAAEEEEEEAGEEAESPSLFTDSPWVKSLRVEFLAAASDTLKKPSLGLGKKKSREHISTLAKS
jgi:hypothetical protein